MTYERILGVISERERAAAAAGIELIEGGPVTRVSVAAEWILKLQAAIRDLAGNGVTRIAEGEPPNETVIFDVADPDFGCCP